MNKIEEIKVKLTSDLKVYKSLTPEQVKIFNAAATMYKVKEALKVENFYLLENVFNDEDLGRAYVERKYNTDYFKGLLEFINFKEIGECFREQNVGDFTEYGWLGEK